MSWKFMSTQKPAHEMFVASLFKIVKKLEATKMSFNGWMNKQTVIHPYTWILLSNEIVAWILLKLQKHMKET